MLKFKMYVVNSPDLVVAVQRNTKTLLAGPIQAAATSRLLDLRDEDTATFTKKTQDENGQWLNRHLLNTANHVQMLPGPNLDSALRKMQNTLNPLLDQLQARTESDEGAVIGLYAWTRKTMSLATTEAIYGRENPFKLEPELIDAFWCV
jgi:hypothetical protein